MMVEVLYFDGCPNHEALLPHLSELLESSADLGLKCRLFATRDGLQGVPADDRVVAAVQRAQAPSQP